jgi:cobalamin biosynthesis Mg chelatase CobN
MLDRSPRSRVLGPGLLEEAEDVLGARGGPQGEETVIAIGERAASADGHQARVPDLGEDHEADSSAAPKDKSQPSSSSRGSVSRSEGILQQEAVTSIASRRSPQGDKPVLYTIIIIVVVVVVVLFVLSRIRGGGRGI